MVAEQCPVHTNDIKTLKENQAKQGKQIDDISRFVTTSTIVIENIDKNIAQLVQADSDKQDTIIKMLTDNSHMLEKIDAHGRRILDLEKANQDGSPALLNAIHVRTLETNSLKDWNNRLQKGIDKQREEYGKLNEECVQIKEHVKTQDDEIKELKSARNKAIVFIIGSWIGIIGVLIKGSMS